MVLLNLNNIHTFYGKSHVIQGISCSINNGEVVCLLGRNGAGKTTTLKSIIGLTPPKSGSIKFQGEEIVGKPPFWIARLGIGYVPEDRRVFPDLTVKENLEVMPKRKLNKEIEWCVDRIFESFTILKRLQNNKGMELSGGEQQMLTIARTLMTNPEILLLDEPSEGLGPIIVKEVGELIKRIKTEITILLVEQNARFAIDLSDRGYVIEKGRIWYEGDKKDLKENKEIRDKYLAV